jgi:Fatty acid desaturase
VDRLQSQALQPEFDLERYLRASGATRPEAFDWSMPGPALDEEALFCLGYMMDIESHTIIYMQELLSTSVVEDVTVTSFLSCWVYEEFFHSQVLKRFLRSQGLAVNDRRFAALRRRKATDYHLQKIVRLLSRLTHHFPAVHMTFGAINELSTLTGYQALAQRTGHPLLRTVLSRIVKDERRHFAFYFNQARRRLCHPIARTMTTMIVRHFWTPVGSRVRTDADMRRVCAYLFGDRHGARRLAEHDSMIARLPGLEWFDLGSRYCLDRPPIRTNTAATTTLPLASIA